MLKVHSRCDLSCDHCYVYEHADQTWRTKPRRLIEPTAGQAAFRIAEHAAQHRLDTVHVVLHGGEPLLLGHDGLSAVLHTLRARIAPVTRLSLRIQTNGVLLDERLCDLFAEYGVQVGVSLDGDQAANDRHRRFADGRSSHAVVRRGLALLRRPAYRQLYAGLLCTVDLENDPIAVYEALLAEQPPAFDLLLPHATWDHPPSRPPGAAAPYAAWLGTVYDRWRADGCPVPIRLFDSLRSAWHGHRSWTEAVGTDSVDLLVIDTDGAWEQADSLKTAFDGAPATGRNVFDHSVDEVAAHPGVAARLAGAGALCATCRACPVVRACGGGLYAHRYKTGSGFDNPSVYCADLKALIGQLTAEGSGGRPARPRPAASAPAPLAGHALAPDAFDRLAAGPGDPAGMAALLDTRWSVTRSLVSAVGAGIGSGRDELDRIAADGWALLCTLDAQAPDAVREVLSYPYVQAWAVRCLRPAQDADPGLDRAHLAGLAAAAALRAQVPVELVLPVRSGAIYLPSVGALAVQTSAGQTAAVRVSPDGFSLAGRTGRWQPVRQVTIAGRPVTVDDLDPFRDCQVWAPAERLPDASWQAWRRALEAAAAELAAQLPRYAQVVAMGLRSVLPLRPERGGHSRSGTARHAFGALAMALPADVDTLSVLLLHEMQHAKLAALGDLYDLFDRGDGRLFQVGWRADPRPAEGVLHGAYAHLAVAEWWRARRQDPADRVADGTFQLYRSWVAEALDALLRASVLTADGERLVGGMARTVEAWSDAQ